MDDSSTRKLRVRRPPPYLIGDNSDPELFGYARNNFTKVPISITKDFVSPAQQLNSLAKLLSKFVNSANRLLLEKSIDKHPKEPSATKNKSYSLQQETKKAISTNEGPKKKQNAKYENKDNASKSNKQINSIKQKQKQKQISLASKQKNKNPQISKKDHEYFSKNPNPNNINKPDYLDNAGANYYNKLQQLKQGISLGNLNKLQVDAANRAYQQQQQILKYSSSMRDKLQTQSNFNLDRSSKKNDQSGEKFFRRSTYHIAIAYNIYLNNIKTSGKDLQSPMMLDPTQPAKRLRGQNQPSSSSIKR